MAARLAVIFCILLSNIYHDTRAIASSAFLDQGFQFDYTPTGAPVPIPTTEQCDEIPLSWSRGSDSSGPNPQAPYYIQVYTSTFLFPSVINVGSGLSDNWPVPYNPGTQYQICMFASNGVSGGCQRLTTVIPKANTSLNDPPTCTNLTYPQAILDVAANDHTGNLSQYGWIDQCTDIMVQPKNGTPPFTLTIAPTLHPPWNITSNDMSAINWTVQLSWASSFFISLVDSTGMTWAFGPLHSGGNGPTSCLAIGETDNNVSKGVAAGAGVGGLVAGLVVGAIGAFFFFRRRQRSGPYYDYPSDRIHNYSLTTGGGGGKRSPLEGEHYEGLPNSPPSTDLTNMRSTSGVSANSRSGLLPAGSGYEIEPFIVPTGSSSDEALLRGATVQSPDPQTLSQQSGSESNRHQPPSNFARERSGGSGHVYVVHHDGGRAPVTVYAEDGTEIIELPPRYVNDSEGIPRRLEAPQEQRRLGPRPRKEP